MQPFRPPETQGSTPFMRLARLTADPVRGLWPIFLLAAFASGAGAPAAETDKEQEAKDAKEEERLESEQGTEKIRHLFGGKLSLRTSEDNPDVVGTFTCEGRIYYLKLTEPDLLPQLKAYNGKEVTLVGRPRSKGKYFVARGFEHPGGAPVSSRPRGGL